MERVTLIIKGQVQGVFYRGFIKSKAQELNLVGFAKNQPDGTVLVVAEGQKSALEKLIASCWQGTPWSKVTSIEQNWGQYRGEFQEFRTK